GIRDRNVTGVQTCALPILRVADPGDPVRDVGAGEHGTGEESDRVHGGSFRAEVAVCGSAYRPGARVGPATGILVRGPTLTVHGGDRKSVGWGESGHGGGRR